MARPFNISRFSGAPPYRTLSATISLNLLIFVLFAAAGVFIFSMVDAFARKAALQEAREKATIILDLNLATHKYLNSTLKPSVFGLAAGTGLPEGYFEPSWMSSTYAVREIVKIFSSEEDLSGYYYKEAAINARTPSNEADGVERAFIEKLNSDPTVNSDAGVREIDGEPYYVVMHRGETMQDNCLMCHSTAENAPAGLLQHYGSERSFGRHVDEVVSALSIRIPLSKAYARADELSRRLKVLLLLALSLLLVTQIYITTRLKHSNELLKRNVAEKETLMREIHHRVKNNLVVVQSLLSMQEWGLKSDESRMAITDARNRLRSMTMIHERLHNAGDLKSIGTREYFTRLINMLAESYTVAGKMELGIDIEDLSLDVDAVIPLALIVNELVSNSLKYASGPGRALNVSLAVKSGKYELVVADNGPGLPEDVATDESQSMGLRIVSSLADQLNGELDVSGPPGAKFVLIFRPSSRN